MNLRISFLLSLMLPWLVNASDVLHPTPFHLGTSQQRLKAQQWNQTHSVLDTLVTSPTWTPQRPFSEVETTGYVAISGSDDYELPALRQAIAQNLPQGVTLIVYVNETSEVPVIQQALGHYLPADRLKFLTIPVTAGGDAIWARDSLPFPVYLKPAAGARNPTFGLVDSIYPQDFNPDPQIASALSLQMIETNQTFRGGNLLFDLRGNCFAENANEVAALSDPTTFLTHYFGCATVTLLNQEGGIGDIDERIKFLSGNVALTDNAAYQQLLAAKGYEVHIIPSTGAPDETYMNTLLVNGTIFVPQMGIAADQQALAAYQALGFHPVGVITKSLADQGLGNIHCVTMNYPPGAFAASAQGAQFVRFAN